MIRAIRDFQEGTRRGESFRVLFDVYYRPVQSFFSKRLRDANESLDLTQETFARVYKGLRGYRGEAPFGAWLFRIAWNVLRKRQSGSPASVFRERQVPLDEVATKAEVVAAGGGPAEIAGEGSALGRLLRGEEREILRRAIGELPDQRRRCMVLWAYHELSYEQIARVMQLSIGTIKAHLAQGRKQLESLVTE